MQQTSSGTASLSLPTSIPETSGLPFAAGEGWVGFCASYLEFLAGVGAPVKLREHPLSTEGRMMVRVRPASCERAARSIPTSRFLSPRVLESGWHRSRGMPRCLLKGAQGANFVPLGSPAGLVIGREGASTLKAGVFLADSL